jgi:putative SOS response-associated peptidase YedK
LPAAPDPPIIGGVMCGRFLLHSPLAELQRAFRFAGRPNLEPRFNVAPTQRVAIVRLAAGDGGTSRRELALVRWGLVPAWAKDPAIGSRMINARAEGIAGKPAFRAAFRQRRALVPADGFYEWKRMEGGRKQPMLVRRRDRRPFAFAGLWESWRGPDGAPLETMTIVTTEPNGLMAGIHDRMPVILGEDDHEAWLDPGRPGGAALLRPCPAGWLEAVPVSTRVNSPRNDDAALVEPEPEPADEPEAAAQGTLV